MEQAPLRFYFDFISSYAYLAWTQVHALAARHQRQVEPVPVLFAALLNAHGHKGPAEIPPKRVYIFKNVVRLAHRLGVPLQPAPAHPFNPLLALRVAGLPLDPATRRRLIDGLFGAAWGGGGGIERPAQVAEVATAAGLDGAERVRAAGEAAAKERLRHSTEEALRLGAFGVPTVIADSELFWGYDAFPDVDDFLAGCDPVTPELLAAWADLPASAQRRS